MMDAAEALRTATRRGLLPYSISRETYFLSATQTSVTPLQHVTRGRLERLALLMFLSDRLDDCHVTMTSCRDDTQRAQLLDALCMRWFGPIFPKPPRPDRGSWHWLPKPVRRTCQHCGGRFNASRMDARFCRNACRQAAYRQRKDDRP